MWSPVYVVLAFRAHLIDSETLAFSSRPSVCAPDVVCPLCSRFTGAGVGVYGCKSYIFASDPTNLPIPHWRMAEHVGRVHALVSGPPQCLLVMPQWKRNLQLHIRQ